MAEDQLFTYEDMDIDKLSEHLSIHWEPSKLIPFGAEVPFLSFSWNLCTQVIQLLDGKRTKYLSAIAEWEGKHMHDLLEMQKLYSKLHHATMVLPAGRAYLTSLEAMLATCSNNPVLLHSPP